jgi:heme exporter protein D
MSGSSWTDFLAMGGYGPYVWGAYLVALAVVVVELILLRLRRRNILRYFGESTRREPGHGGKADSGRSEIGST